MAETPEDIKRKQQYRQRMIALQRYQAALKDIASVIPFNYVGQLEPDTIEAMKHAVMLPLSGSDEEKQLLEGRQ